MCVGVWCGVCVVCVYEVKGVYDLECEQISNGVSRQDQARFLNRHMDILGGIFLQSFPHISDSHGNKSVPSFFSGCKLIPGLDICWNFYADNNPPHFHPRLPW